MLCGDRGETSETVSHLICEDHCRCNRNTGAVSCTAVGTCAGDLVENRCRLTGECGCGAWWTKGKVGDIFPLLQNAAFESMIGVWLETGCGIADEIQAGTSSYDSRRVYSTRNNSNGNLLSIRLSLIETYKQNITDLLTSGFQLLPPPRSALSHPKGVGNTPFFFLIFTGEEIWRPDIESWYNIEPLGDCGCISRLPLPFPW